jgi:hypothetical protein
MLITGCKEQNMERLHGYSYMELTERRLRKRLEKKDFKSPVNDDDDDDDKVAPGLKVTFSVVDHHLLPCLHTSE